MKRRTTPRCDAKSGGTGRERVGGAETASDLRKPWKSGATTSDMTDNEKARLWLTGGIILSAVATVAAVIIAAVQGNYWGIVLLAVTAVAFGPPMYWMRDKPTSTTPDHRREPSP